LALAARLSARFVFPSAPISYTDNSTLLDVPKIP
jgi:hypothetical protein